MELAGGRWKRELGKAQVGGEGWRTGRWSLAGSGWKSQHLPLFTLQPPALSPTQEEPDDLGKEERGFLRPLKKKTKSGSVRREVEVPGKSAAPTSSGFLVQRGKLTSGGRQAWS